jgi:translocator protein
MLRFCCLRKLLNANAARARWLPIHLSAALTLPIVAATLTVLLMLAVGGWSTTAGTWYENLRKPSWNPPNWIFGPAWVVILGLAAWAGVSAWSNATDDSERILVRALFGTNIVLHMLWSPLFFALKRPDWALIEVPFLWLSIAALMLGVGRYSVLTMWLLLPYLLWVTFAVFLNLKIVRLNQPFRKRA